MLLAAVKCLVRCSGFFFKEPPMFRFLVVLWLLHYHDGAVRVVGAVVAHAPKDGPARTHHVLDAECVNLPVSISQANSVYKFLKQTERKLNNVQQQTDLLNAP